ncbi:MAG TPA: hypothetical protein DCP92_18160 [Nitrospiraceae bacterium]|jgi:chemotaxis response regulator CheB|nr:hypothetical protein [Nitrospiraceae bacterium]
MKVFLISDSHSIRRKITDVICSVPGIDIVGKAVNSLNAIAQIETLKPDAVILDIRLQKTFGVDVLLNISNMMPTPVTIVVADSIFGRSTGKEKIKPDFVVDKFTECDKIAELLKGIVPPRQRSHAG